MTSSGSPHARAMIFRHGRGQLGSMIYGTILVMAALTAAYAAGRHDPRKLIELVVSAVIVFWPPTRMRTRSPRASKAGAA